jgi:ribosomal protein L13
MGTGAVNVAVAPEIARNKRNIIKSVISVLLPKRRRGRSIIANIRNIAVALKASHIGSDNNPKRNLLMHSRL